MDHNNTVTPAITNGDDASASLNEFLSELRAWRAHANRKEAVDDEQLLRTFTDMGEIMTTVQQRANMFREQTT